MNQSDANRIHDAAPDGFSEIIDLTVEEKQELLDWWFNR
jgi:hypothetical protein